MIKLSPEVQAKIKKAQQERDARPLKDVIKDIRKERKERQKLLIRRMLQKK